MRPINRGQLTLDHYRAINEDYSSLVLGSENEDEQCAIIDCITDVLAYACTHGHDIGAIISMAGIHVDCEREGING